MRCIFRISFINNEPLTKFRPSRPKTSTKTSHLGSVSNLMDMFNAVRSVLHNIGADASTGLIRADGDTSFNHLISFEFVFIMCLMREVLEIAHMLSHALQKKSQDIINAIRLVSSTKDFLQKLREHGWESFLAKILKFYETYQVNVPDMGDTYILKLRWACSAST
jgi:hypothetical protein